MVEGLPGAGRRGPRRTLVGVASATLIATSLVVASSGSTAAAGGTEIIATISGDGITLAYGLAYRPSTNTMYLADRGGSRIRAIDAATNTLTAFNVALGGQPSWVGMGASEARDDTLYVTGGTGTTGQVWALDPDTGSFVTTGPVITGGPGDFGGVVVKQDVNGANQTVYEIARGATAFVPGSVVPIDPKTLARGTPIPVGNNPSNLVLVGDYLFVANVRSDTVSVIDTRTNTVTKTITGLTAGPSSLAVSPDKRTIYVTKYFTPAGVAVIDVATQTVTRTITTGVPAGAAAIGIQADTLFIKGSPLGVTALPVANPAAATLVSFSGSPFSIVTSAAGNIYLSSPGPAPSKVVVLGTLTPPTVTAISPATGPTAGGTQVTITGAGFAANSTVTIGGVACTNVTVVSATQIRCTTGAKAAGTYDVVVTSSGASATLAAAFTYSDCASTPRIATRAVTADFRPSTADQSPGPISLSGFSDTAMLIVGIALDGAPSGTTFRLPVTTGLTPSYGYTFTDAMTNLTLTGSVANVNAALAALLISTGAAEGEFTIKVTGTPTAPNLYINPENGHFYEYMPGSITWTAAREGAKSRTLNGATGYLVTITSAAENRFVASYTNSPNIWIGASDQDGEGTWKWMDGPEAGVSFWVGNATGSVVPPFDYASWARSEPNNTRGAENYAVTNWRGTFGFRNDLTVNTFGIGGYLIAYSAPEGGYCNVATTDVPARVGAAPSPSPSPPPSPTTSPSPTPSPSPTDSPSPSPSPSPTDSPSPSPSPTDSPSPSPSPTPTPSVDPVPVPPLEPGEPYLVIDNEPEPVVVEPNPRNDGVNIEADGWTMTLDGLDGQGKPIRLAPGGVLVIDAERDVQTTGTNFKPGSDVELFVDPPTLLQSASTVRTWFVRVVERALRTIFLGTVKVQADGNFAGIKTLPPGIDPGAHVVQALGYGPSGDQRAMSLGIYIRPWIVLDQGVRMADGLHDRIRTTGTSGGIEPGTRLSPWIRYTGDAEFKGGVATITVQADGSFRWTREIKKTKGLTGYVSWTDIESNRVFWAKVR